MIDLKGVDCLFIVKKDLHRSSLRLLKVLRLPACRHALYDNFIAQKIEPKVHFLQSFGAFT